MTTIDQTPFGRLEDEGRLFNAVLKGPTTKDGRFAFRGDIALKFQEKLADEARPPEYSIEQVISMADGGDQQIPILAGYLHSFEWLKDFVDVMGDLLGPDGKYFMFCNNVDFSTNYSVTIDEKTFYILPLDESTVWKEMLDLLNIEKNDIKKMNTAGKTDYVMDAGCDFAKSFDEWTFEKGVEKMEPVRNRNENRPV